MINTAQIEYIDVQREYFGISEVKSWSGKIIFDGDDVKVIMNHIISKPYAINIARNLFLEQKNEYSNLYVSCEAMKAGQIYDYFGDRVFQHLDGAISGWLFFFDPTPFVNWNHRCRYLFVIDTNNYEEIEYNKGLDENIQMEKIY